jgi:hypothetical protein
MSMFRPAPHQQNDVAEWVRSIDAQLRKFFQGGKFNFAFGSAVGQLTRSGQATVGTGTTSVVVTHGLGATPTLQQIHITLGNSPTNAIGAPWVSTITSTQFTINCANPGASGAFFGWMVVPI